MKPPAVVTCDEGKDVLEQIRKGLVPVFTLALALYNIWTGYFGYPNPLFHRSLNLLFAFVLVFLLFPLDYRRRSGTILRLVDLLLAAASVVVFLWPVLYYPEIETRLGLLEPLTPAQWALGIGAILLILEVCRRTVGWVFVGVLVFFFIHAAFGERFPGFFVHRGFSLAEVVETFYIGYKGIFGMPTAVYATYLILFVLWGSFFERSGVGKFLLDFSRAVAGGARGGPAKIAVLSSACFGSVSGSAVANVYTTGSVTIPLMKKLGYQPHYAGAVEAVASTGGQIMPPVMGAAAFVMVEFLEIPYVNLIQYAAIPAGLYFFAVLMMIHFEALKLDLKGIPRGQLPPLGATLLRQGYLIAPLIGLLVVLLMGYSPVLAALVALLMTIGLLVIHGIASGVKETLRGKASPVRAAAQVARQVAKDTFLSFQDAARPAAVMGATVAGAGIVVASVAMTGLGLNLTSIATGGHLPMLAVLIFVAATCIVLGMAVPTTPAYIMTAALAAPAMVGLGVMELQAHMFIFYFATLSMVTPPVALSAYAGAQIAGANMMRTGFTAARLAMAAYIIPFMFVYGPALLLQGSVSEILWSIFTATIGVTALAAALEGYLLTQTRTIDRCCLGGAALSLIHTGPFTDGLGGLLLVIAILVQGRRRKLERARRESNASLRPEMAPVEAPRE